MSQQRKSAWLTKVHAPHAHLPSSMPSFVSFLSIDRSAVSTKYSIILAVQN
jgi:hypothetical protein